MNPSRKHPRLTIRGAVGPRAGGRPYTRRPGARHSLEPRCPGGVPLAGRGALERCRGGIGAERRRRRRARGHLDLELHRRAPLLLARGRGRRDHPRRRGRSRAGRVRPVSDRRRSGAAPRVRLADLDRTRGAAAPSVRRGTGPRPSGPRGGAGSGNSRSTRRVPRRRPRSVRRRFPERGGRNRRPPRRSCCGPTSPPSSSEASKAPSVAA